MNNNEARQYFQDKGLTYNVLNSQSIKLLTKLLRDEIQKAKDSQKDCILESINYYRYSPKHRNVCLTVKGTYFDNREAITFNNDGFIGFAGWACTENTKPFIDGFIKWCDCLSDNHKAYRGLERLAELGKLALQTELCYWGYQYNDGDCNEEKYPCVRNELCKMKAEEVKDGKTKL